MPAVASSRNLPSISRTPRLTSFADVHILPLAPPAASTAVSGLKRYLGGLPSAVFQKSLPDRKWGVADRAATYVKLGLEYSLGGFKIALPAGS